MKKTSLHEVRLYDLGRHNVINAEKIKESVEIYDLENE
jgi:hypothetical protein